MFKKCWSLNKLYFCFLFGFDVPSSDEFFRLLLAFEIEPMLLELDELLLLMIKLGLCFDVVVVVVRGTLKGCWTELVERTGLGR